MTRLLVPLMFLAACEPPPEVTVATQDTGTVEPSLRLLYPLDQDTIMLNQDDCTLSFDVVVDIDNLEIIDPSTVEDEVDGQGHWHLYVDGDKVTGKAEVQAFNSEDLAKAGSDYIGPIEIEGELQSNRHNALEQFTNYVDRIEVTVVAGPACE